ncbi:MAG: hypothetical protein LUE14_07800 [Clostridiales bacterium]|nr:hypothetical protein [Clostridiales bacterium]
MKLIAHSFLEEYLPTSRCRKLRTRFQYGAMPVTLAEPSESDFPVAFIVHNFGTTYEFEGRSEDVSGLRPEDYSERVLGYFDNEIRAYKGRLFQAMRASDRYYMAPGWLALDDAGYFIDDYGCRGYYQDNTLPESAVVKTSTEEETISS